jgi:hypothetical protein
MNLFFHTEDGGDMFLRNVGLHSKDYTALYLRKWYSSIVGVNYVLGLLHRVDVGDVADVLEVLLLPTTRLTLQIAPPHTPETSVTSATFTRCNNPRTELTSVQLLRTTL